MDMSSLIPHAAASKKPSKLMVTRRPQRFCIVAESAGVDCVPGVGAPNHPSMDPGGRKPWVKDDARRRAMPKIPVHPGRRHGARRRGWIARQQPTPALRAAQSAPTPPTPRNRPVRHRQRAPPCVRSGAARQYAISEPDKSPAILTNAWVATGFRLQCGVAKGRDRAPARQPLGDASGAGGGPQDPSQPSSGALRPPRVLARTGRRTNRRWHPATEPGSGLDPAVGWWPGIRWPGSLAARDARRTAFSRVAMGCRHARAIPRRGAARLHAAPAVDRGHPTADDGARVVGGGIRRQTTACTPLDGVTRRQELRPAPPINGRPTLF